MRPEPTRREIIAPPAAGVQPRADPRFTGFITAGFAGDGGTPAAGPTLNLGIGPIVRADSGDERRRNRIRIALEG